VYYNVTLLKIVAVRLLTFQGISKMEKWRSSCIHFSPRISTTDSTSNSKAAFTPGQHVARQHVFCCRQRVACISATKLLPLLPVCCWIQMDISRPWHKWIVILLCCQDTANMLPKRATCSRATGCRQHMCWRQHVARPGNMLPWCKGGLKLTWRVK